MTTEKPELTPEQRAKSRALADQAAGLAATMEIAVLLNCQEGTPPIVMLVALSSVTAQVIASCVPANPTDSLEDYHEEEIQAFVDRLRKEVSDRRAEIGPERYRQQRAAYARKDIKAV